MSRLTSFHYHSSFHLTFKLKRNGSFVLWFWLSNWEDKKFLSFLPHSYFGANLQRSIRPLLRHNQTIPFGQKGARRCIHVTRSVEDVEDEQWSIHRGSILIKASTRSKYHRRGNIPRTIPDVFNLVSHAPLHPNIFPSFVHSPFPLKETEKIKTEIFSNENPSPSTSNKTSENEERLIIYPKVWSPPHKNSPPNQNSKTPKWDPIDRSTPRNPSRAGRRYGWREDVVSWDVQIARDDDDDDETVM